MTIPRPPAHIEPYVTALGAEATVRFLLAFGGANLYIAADPKGGSMAVDVIGLEGMQALARIRDRLPHRVPLAKPWVARYLSEVQGLSQSDIARKMHVSVPTVTKYLSGTGPRAFPNPNQLSLF